MTAAAGRTTYELLRPGGTDIAADLQAALNQYDDVRVVANGDPYHLSSTITIPTRRRLWGDATLRDVVNLPGQYYGTDIFRVNGVVRDVVIEGLTFEGLHPGGWTNAQMAMFRFAPGSDAQQTTFKNCTFRNLIGFSVQSFGGADLRVENCTFIHCGNGLNVSTPRQQLLNNTFVDSEGIEAAAAYTRIAGNRFIRALTAAVSIGGDLSGVWLPGIVVEDCVIESLTSGSAIAVADGCDGAIVRNCQINDFGASGVVVLLSAEAVVPTAIRNLLVENCSFSGGSWAAVNLFPYAFITGTVIQGCTIAPSATRQNGVRVAASGAQIINNVFPGTGTEADLYFAATAIGATESGNTYTTLVDNR